MHRDIQILVVDDEAAFCTLLRIALQHAGYTVQVAGTGQTALALYARHPIDLVLLDILLPDMDGFAVCVELRKRSHVPIVMLSALNRPEAIVQGFNLGVDEYIAKPCPLREVVVRLQAVLRRSTGRP